MLVLDVSLTYFYSYAKSWRQVSSISFQNNIQLLKLHHCCCYQYSITMECKRTLGTKINLFHEANNRYTQKRYSEYRVEMRVLLCFQKSVMCSTRKVKVEDEYTRYIAANSTLLKKNINNNSSSPSSMTMDQAYSLHYQQKKRFLKRRNAILHRIF